MGGDCGPKAQRQSSGPVLIALDSRARSCMDKASTLARRLERFEPAPFPDAKVGDCLMESLEALEIILGRTEADLDHALGVMQ